MKQHVDTWINFRSQWIHYHSHLCYCVGTPVLTDDVYDKYYRHLTDDFVGCNCVQEGSPPIPERACFIEEQEATGIPLYDILTECRKDRALP